MAFGYFLYGDLFIDASAQQSFLINTSGQKVGMRFYAPKTGNIAAVGFRTGTVTTPQSLTLSLQDGDNTAANAPPDGVQDQTGTVASPTSNTNFTVTLGAVRAVTAGDIIWAVIEFTSTTGNLNIVGVSGGATNLVPCNIYTQSSGTWTNQNRTPILWVQYDDGLYYPIFGTLPGSVTSENWNNGSVPANRGMRFKVPIAMQMSGFRWYGNLAGNTDITLYDDDGTTVLATATMDKDQYPGTTSHLILLNTATTLHPGRVYRLILSPSSASNTQFITYTGDTTATLGQTAGGIEWQLTRGSSGSWTEFNTIRPHMSLYVSAVPQSIQRVDGGVVN